MVAIAVAGTACARDAPSALDPAGPGAERVARLWWQRLTYVFRIALIVPPMVAAAVAHRVMRGLAAVPDAPPSEVPVGAFVRPRAWARARPGKGDG